MQNKRSIFAVVRNGRIDRYLFEGGMYSGQTVQNLPLVKISSDRRNPIFADVMNSDGFDQYKLYGL